MAHFWAILGPKPSPRNLFLWKIFLGLGFGPRSSIFGLFDPKNGKFDHLRSSKIPFLKSSYTKPQKTFWPPKPGLYEDLRIYRPVSLFARFLKNDPNFSTTVSKIKIKKWRTSSPIESFFRNRQTLQVLTLNLRLQLNEFGLFFTFP